METRNLCHKKAVRIEPIKLSLSWDLPTYSFVKISISPILIDIEIAEQSERLFTTS